MNEATWCENWQKVYNVSQDPDCEDDCECDCGCDDEECCDNPVEDDSDCGCCGSTDCQSKATFVIDGTDGLGEHLQWFSVNYASKAIDVSIIDTPGGETHAWVQSICEQTAPSQLNITAYSAEGYLIGTYTFTGINVYDHNFHLEQGDRNPATHSLLLSFDRMIRE